MGATAEPKTMVRPAPRWTVPDPPSEQAIARLQAELNLPRALNAVLVARGYGTPEEAKRYLRPEVAHLHDPSELPGLLDAVDRIERALRDGERILVHGDYDVDGISGAALLTHWLRRCGGDVEAFVPHRLKDGYDFGPAGVAAALEAGATLVVTVDCGIRAHDAVAEAKRAGLDVIVTDHHRPTETLPDALAVVNPNRSDSTYPNPGLAGAGVAFKLCQQMALERDMPLEELLPQLDLVALASIADLVPLTGENRVLTRVGLRALERTERVGLRALLGATGLEGNTLDSGNVGFVLAPPINAAGRIAEARTALELMLNEERSSAERNAQELVRLNRQRQEEDKRTLEEALARLAQRDWSQPQFGVVVAGEGWHPGVIGIVASRIVERVHRPVVVVALSGEGGRGSCRSIPGFDLYAALSACEHLLERFGGHKMAAGLDIRRDRLDAFRAHFEQEVRKRLTPEVAQPSLRPDIELDLAEIDDRFYDLLQYAGPFGMGNPRPTFLARSVELSRPPREVGRGHLAVEVQSGRRRFGGIGFGLAERVPPASLGTGPVDLVFQIRRETYQGRTSLRLRVKDVRPTA